MIKNIKKTWQEEYRPLVLSADRDKDQQPLKKRTMVERYLQKV